MFTRSTSVRIRCTLPPPLSFYSKMLTHLALLSGRAIDMLRNDYPKVFTEKPDFSIFRKDIELHDPSGKRLTGLSQYEKVFDMLRFLRRTTMQDAQVTYRLVVADERVSAFCQAHFLPHDAPLSSFCSHAAPPFPPSFTDPRALDGQAVDARPRARHHHHAQRRPRRRPSGRRLQL